MKNHLPSFQKQINKLLEDGISIFYVIFVIASA